MIGARGEADFWNVLKAETKARWWPELAVSQRFERVRNAVLLVIGIGSPVVWCMFWGSTGLLTGLFLFILVAMLLFHLEKPQKRFIPWRLTKVKDLVPYAATAPGIEWSREDVAGAVREIVEEVLAPGDKYREDADFVNDLGLG